MPRKSALKKDKSEPPKHEPFHSQALELINFLKFKQPRPLKKPNQSELPNRHYPRPRRLNDLSKEPINKPSVYLCDLTDDISNNFEPNGKKSEKSSISIKMSKKPSEVAIKANKEPTTIRLNLQKQPPDRTESGQATFRLK